MDMHNKGMFTSNTCMWGTPQKFFDELNKEFNFDVDVCAVQENAKCKNFFTPEMDGLKQSWGGIQVYGVTLRMVEKCRNG